MNTRLPRLFFLVLACLGLLQTAACQAPSSRSEPREVTRETLAGRDGRTVEIFWSAPSADGPWPALLYLHGHQLPGRQIGGRHYVDNGQLKARAAQGYFVVAMSQPGYGASDGPPDYAGPASQDAALLVLSWMRNKPFVKQDKIGVYGYSRGAILGSMVATRDAGLAAVILGGGAYDFGSFYKSLPPSQIKRNIAREAGTSETSFAARSALFRAEAITAPVLLLHGVNDSTVSVTQAKLFQQRLAEVGKAAKLVTFPHTDHGIPSRDQEAAILPFLRAYLE